MISPVFRCPKRIWSTMKPATLNKYSHWTIFRLSYLLMAMFILAASAASGIAQQAGDLDATFGLGGKLTGWTGQAYAVAIQSDGKIVVAGNNYVPPGWNSDFVIARYNSDGSPDNSFGTGGRGVIPVSNSFHDA